MLAALLVLFVATANAVPCSVTVDGNLVSISSGYLLAQFNLSRASLDLLKGRFSGDGNFDSSPNLAGALKTSIVEPRRGGIAVARYGTPGVFDSTTADFDRINSAIVTANSADFASFYVILGDSASPLLQVNLTFSVSSANPRALSVSTSVLAKSSFEATRVTLSTRWAPPDVISWYQRGVRQGFNMPSGFIASANPLVRWYSIGDGATGAVEVLPISSNPLPSSFYAGQGGSEGDSLSGLDLPLWGAPAQLDSWVDSFTGGSLVDINAGSVSSSSIDIYPNDYSFPPSKISAPRASSESDDDLATILAAAHGSSASALHSYDFFPEVRSAPCQVHSGPEPCYGGLYNFYDPDSAISNSIMLWSFDPLLHDAVRGQLETNMAHVCADGQPADQCEVGQCIHHFVGSCDSSPECFCKNMPSGVQDCAVYDAISGAVQTGPNIFTILASIRYVGATGNQTWLSSWISTLRSMMSFLDRRFIPERNLYLAPGSLQIDVFIRQNFTADSNAAMVILSEAFADLERSLGNTSGYDFYMTRAANLRIGMNAYLLSPDGDHYCTQSDPVDASNPGGPIRVCTRDFVDYDANLLAVAAKVPPNTTFAEQVLSRIDRGTCTHTGRATWVSEIMYNASNCVNGNTGDSAVSMGRIAWQDGLARQAIGGSDAKNKFETLIAGPLQADVLKRTWLPERFDCQGRDAHNSYYFEYASVAGMLVFEIRYGIKLLPSSVTLDPLGGSAFDFEITGLRITYSHTSIHIQLPSGHFGARTITVTGVSQGSWTWTVGGAGPNNKATVGADGILTFLVDDVSKGAVDAIFSNF